jgi:hypothetical protein
LCVSCVCLFVSLKRIGYPIYQTNTVETHHEKPSAGQNCKFGHTLDKQPLFLLTKPVVL